MTVDDVSNEPAKTWVRSSDPLHTVITAPTTVDLRADDEAPETETDPQNLAVLQAEIQRLSERVDALEADRDHTRRPTKSSSTGHQAGGPTIRRRTRAERQTGWQPAKR